MKDAEPKVKCFMPKCPMSLRPDERVMLAYVMKMPYAIEIVNSWNPKRLMKIVTASPVEWAAMQECEVIFGGAA